MTEANEKSARKPKASITTYWTPEKPLILASNSVIRSKLLSKCNIEHKVVPANIDERAIEQNAWNSTDVAMHLAEAKAKQVSARYPESYVLGADQTCMLENTALHKPSNIEELSSQLRFLRGKTHILTSAAAIAIEGQILAKCSASAHIEMRDFSDTFLENYLTIGGDALLQSVGGYQIEGLGITLMKSIAGDIYTVMGLPLLDLLDVFRRLDVLQQ